MTDKPSTQSQEGALAILPVRDTVLFPHAVLPLTVGRESSVQLINSLGEDKTIVVVAQRGANPSAPENFIKVPGPHSVLPNLMTKATLA